MADWMSDEWAAAVAGLTGLLPRADGANGSVSAGVTAGSGRNKRATGFCWSYADGVAADGRSGLDADADLVLTLADDDALDLFRGAVEPSVSFMRGRLKASGDGGLLLGFLRSTADRDYERWREKVALLAPETSIRT